MAEDKVFNRWLVVVGAMLIQVSLGRSLYLQCFQTVTGAQVPHLVGNRPGPSLTGHFGFFCFGSCYCRPHPG